ncbi:MAG TPA: RnfABCDGE type electron transport complex subunit B, partial [bacterium]|nr:RnfABCDGE type electron transport complex subunit B [bacterium]
TAGLVLGGLGLFFGLFLTYFFLKFHVEENPLVASLLSLLPGANCGACGEAGCAGFAQKLAEGKAIPARCVALSQENRKQLCQLLGLSETEVKAVVARVFCSGGVSAVRRFTTNLQDCRALHALFDTHLACPSGCLGLGSCVRSCPFGAIRMGRLLPEVDEKKCVGCGRCVEVCPKEIIKLTLLEKKVYVACSSHDRGATVMKVCKIGCIGCGRCVRICPEKAITLENNLAVIDPERCTNCGRCVPECPRKVIFVAPEVYQPLA